MPQVLPFSCDACGPQESVLVDGYAVGDRLLEGVLFRVTLDSNGQPVVATQAKDAKYMADLNEKKWLREMARYIVETCDTATCEKCGQDVDVVVNV